MIVRARPLVCPGAGEYRGSWYACVRYWRSDGGRGVRILGKGFTTWDIAARQAMAGCLGMPR